MTTEDMHILASEQAIYFSYRIWSQSERGACKIVEFSQ